MSPDAARIVDLAASVADGSDVDWETAERALDEDLRPLVRHLRLVESIATLYRSIPDEGGIPSVDEISDALPGGTWGPLVVLERLGSGTSADVYRAFERTLHREVALKLFRDAADDDAHNAALTEARRLARLDHPNIVRVYGADRHDGRAGIWMELVRGETLDAMVQASGVLPADAVVAVGQDVCSALAAIHEAGLLHRDIKAQNVVRQENGRTVVMDFGSAQRVRRGTGSLGFAGTPLYLAPEIFAGAAATTRSDVYSTGVLLFFLATGQLPVRAASWDDLRAAHADGRRQPLESVRPGLPPELVSVIERALATDPADRYETAGAMEAALRACTLVPVRLASRRRLWLATGVIVVATMGVVPLLWTRVGAGAAAHVPVRSVAVLPLEDLSGGRAPAGFVAGLTDQLIATLGQTSSLRVTSRTSTLAVDRPHQTIPQIAGLLDVDAIVEGTVAIVDPPAPGSAPRARINIRLIAAGSDETLLSRIFERPLGDALALQGEVAASIAGAVDAVRTGQAEWTAARHTTPAAEEAFILGRNHLSRYGARPAQVALDFFKRAASMDPNLAGAWAGIARSYVHLGFHGALPQEEVRTAALDAANRAIDVDAQIPDAFAARGDVYFYYDWDTDSARVDYERALALNPSDTYARSQYANLLAASGHPQEAVVEADRTATSDPLSPEAAVTLGMMRLYNHEFAAALSAFDRALTLDPSSVTAYIGRSRVFESQRRFTDAIQQADHALFITHGDGVPLRIHRVCLLAKAGRMAEAREALQTIDQEAAARGVAVPDEYRGFVQLAFGEPGLALDLFARAVADHHPMTLWLGVDPRLESLRGDPRFQALTAQLRQ